MKLRILNSPWPALVWTIIIFILLVIPLHPVSEGHFLSIPQFDKIVHAFLFGLLVWLWSRRSLTKSTGADLKRKIFTIFIVSCLYGAGMEFYQEFFTTREFDIGDIVADVIGAGIAYLICRYYFLKKSKPL